MPAELLAYNESIRENVNIADDLGMLLKTADNGKIKDLANSHYIGLELRAVGEHAPTGCEFRKKDVAGQGTGTRTKNRVIIAVNTETGAPVENLAYFWRHDGRVYKLAPGFFRRAQMLRNL